MLHSPPLPYTGAITLKTFLQPPYDTDVPVVRNCGKKEDGNQINVSFRNAALLEPFWDSNSIIPYSDINEFKLDLLENEDFWRELNPLDLGSAIESLSNVLCTEASSFVAKADVSAGSTIPGGTFRLAIPQPTSVVMTSPTPSPPSYSQSPVADVSPSLASALNASSAKSSALNSSQPPTDHFYEKFTPDALVLASVPGEGLFNPIKRKFKTEELKPQPVLKKSKKTFVADDAKDERYWVRRLKNNTAARRSRDARRIKENQIALRASFLEEENDFLKKELDKFKTENKNLRARLDVYENTS